MVEVSEKSCTICERESDVYRFTVMGLKVAYCPGCYCDVVNTLSPGTYRGENEVTVEGVKKQIRTELGGGS